MSSKLPDYLAPDLRVVICGTAAGKTSAFVGHYYAGQGNLFWTYLYRAQITTEPLCPSLDYRVLEFGVGLTDLAKNVAASSDRRLRGHGKEAAKAFSRTLGRGGDVSLGEQPWFVSGARVFVLPSASGTNRDASRLEGRTDRVEWFEELAARLSPI